MASWSPNCLPHRSSGHVSRSLRLNRVDLLRLTAAQTMKRWRAQSSPDVWRVLPAISDPSTGYYYPSHTTRPAVGGGKGRDARGVFRRRDRRRKPTYTQDSDAREPFSRLDRRLKGLSMLHGSASRGDSRSIDSRSRSKTAEFAGAAPPARRKPFSGNRVAMMRRQAARRLGRGRWHWLHRHGRQNGPAFLS